MKDYGLDGALVQRFLTEAPGKRIGGDAVLRNAMAGALKHGRAFAVEYDLSGADGATLLDRLRTDWTYLVDEVEVTEHSGYLRHQGKPVLAVWGMGLDDGNHPPDNPAAAAALVRWFRQEAEPKYRVAYLGGVPSGWRTNAEDAHADPAWGAVYDSMDIVQPWTVGRYVDSAGADRWKADKLEGDIARTRGAGKGYQPVVRRVGAGIEIEAPAGTAILRLMDLRGRVVGEFPARGRMAVSPLGAPGVYRAVALGEAGIPLAASAFAWAP